MTDQTPITEDVERSRFNVAGVHHIIGTECLCGARRLHKNRDRTEHILDAFIQELDLAAHDRAMKAAAWEEGYEANSKDRVMRFTETHEQHVNPYRFEAGRG